MSLPLSASSWPVAPSSTFKAHHQHLCFCYHIALPLTESSCLLSIRNTEIVCSCSQMATGVIQRLGCISEMPGLLFLYIKAQGLSSLHGTFSRGARLPTRLPRVSVLRERDWKLPIFLKNMPRTGISLLLHSIGYCQSQARFPFDSLQISTIGLNSFFI